MRLKLGVIVCALLLAPTAPALADPMMDAFRAYRKAYQAGDLVQAERHAAEALEAAQAAASSKRGVLALNLAIVRYELGKFAEAKQAAEQAAAALAVEGEVRTARLIAAKSALRLEESGAARALEQLLKTLPPATAETAADVYDAAMLLGRHFYLKQSDLQANDAFMHAVRASDPAFGLSDVERAEALIAAGASELFLEEFLGAIKKFSEAIALTAPAAVESQGPEPSAEEKRYARALAWKAVTRAVAGDRLKNWQDASAIRPSLPDAPPMCGRELVAPLSIRFPPRALTRRTVGAVVARLSLDEQGVVTRAVLAAAVPVEQGFDVNALKSLEGARFRSIEPPESGCRMRSDSVLQTVQFVIG